MTPNPVSKLSESDMGCVRSRKNVRYSGACL